MSRHSRKPQKTCPLAPEGEVVAGYRVIRILGRGARSTVYLGNGEPVADEEGRGPLAAIKVFTAETSDDDVATELDALAAAAGDHVVDLVDLAWNHDGVRTLVLRRLPGPSAATWLRDHTPIPPGQAVTLVISAVRAAAQLWQAGWCHTKLAPAQMLLDEDRRPVLIGLGAAVRVDAAVGGGSPADHAPRSAVLGGLADFADTVTVHLDSSVRARWEERVGARWPSTHEDTGRPLPDVFDEIEALLFDFAAPSGLRALPDPRPVAVPDGDTAPPHPDAAAHRVRSGALSAMVRRVRGLARGVRDRADVPTRADASRAPVERAKALASAHRRPLLAGGILASLLVGVALTVMPMGSNAAEQSGDARTDRPTPAQTTVRGRRARGDANVQATPQTPQKNAVASVRSVSDPVEAAGALLAARDGCLRHGADGCVSRVDQPGSPQAKRDSAIIAQGDGPDEPRYGDWTVTLVQRTGGTALLALRPPASEDTKRPASVLMINTEAGWSVRELFE